MDPMIWLFILPIAGLVIVGLVSWWDRHVENAPLQPQALKFALAHFDELKEPQYGCITRKSLRKALEASGDRQVRKHLGHLLWHAHRIGKVIAEEDTLIPVFSGAGIPATVMGKEPVWGITADDLNKALAAIPATSDEGIW